MIRVPAIDSAIPVSSARQLREGPCNCTFPEQCDSQQPGMLSSLQRAAAATNLGDAASPTAEEEAATAASASVSASSAASAFASSAAAAASSSVLQSYPLDSAPPATPQAADVALAGADVVTPQLEREYVHAMYDAIAPHFRCVNSTLNSRSTHAQHYLTAVEIAFCREAQCVWSTVRWMGCEIHS